MTLHAQRLVLWHSQPICNLAAPPEEKAAYREKERVWLDAMREIDLKLDEERADARR